MVTQFLGNTIVSIATVFSGMWVLFQILERRSHFFLRLLGVLGIAIVQGAIGLLQIPVLNMTSAMLMIVGSTLLCYRCKKLYFLVYDILIALRDQYNFEYGIDKEIDGVVVNDKCKSLAKKVKEIIDTKSSFADWLNNQNVRNQLKLDIKICLVKNGYPPQYSPEVFNKVMEQVENFEENSDMTTAGTSGNAKLYQYTPVDTVLKVAEESTYYGLKKDGE